MTLDVYAEPFDDDLDAVPDAIDEAHEHRLFTPCWHETFSSNKKSPAIPMFPREGGASDSVPAEGFEPTTPALQERCSTN